MNEFVKEIFKGVAEILPGVIQMERTLRENLPVDAPNFPNDLEPVIRVEPSSTVQPQTDEGREEFDEGPRQVRPQRARDPSCGPDRLRVADPARGSQEQRTASGMAT